MALPATGVWEVRPTNGSPTNGGGFDSTQTGSTDYTQQNAKNTVGSNISTTDVTTTTGSPFTITSATAAFTSAVTGNYCYLSGGTGGTVTSAWYYLTYVSATTCNLDRSPGAAATLVTMNIGGALQTLGNIETILTSSSNMRTTGQTFWVKAEATISITATIVIQPLGGNSAGNVNSINGYTTTRGDNGQVTIQASSTGPNPLLTVNPSSTPIIMRNFIIDGNSQAGLAGCSVQGQNSQIENFLVKNCTNGGINFNNNWNRAIRCTVTACCSTSGSAFRMEQSNGANLAVDCVAYANSGVGFLGATMVCIRCIAANNTGASTDGFQFGSNVDGITLDHCISYTNGRDGFRFSGIETPTLFQNCIAYGNSTADVISTTALAVGAITNNYNAYGNISGITAGSKDVTLTADPFVDGTHNNFALNTTTGGGAACVNVGFPGILAIGGTGYANIGTLDPQGGVATVALSVGIQDYIAIADN